MAIHNIKSLAASLRGKIECETVKDLIPGIEHFLCIICLRIKSINISIKIGRDQ